mmetsp:Transcript_13879/g.44634  ORF Transcript_13879/g.44634 Transcript_13879/m.44634 type:complete len:231 (+) Transcript_13879:317-1009(+)
MDPDGAARLPRVQDGGADAALVPARPAGGRARLLPPHCARVLLRRVRPRRDAARAARPRRGARHLPPPARALRRAEAQRTRPSRTLAAPRRTPARPVLRLLLLRRQRRRVGRRAGAGTAGEAAAGQRPRPGRPGGERVASRVVCRRGQLAGWHPARPGRGDRPAPRAVVAARLAGLGPHLERLPQPLAQAAADGGGGPHPTRGAQRAHRPGAAPAAAPAAAQALLRREHV